MEHQAIKLATKWREASKKYLDVDILLKSCAKFARDHWTRFHFNHNSLRV